MPDTYPELDLTLWRAEISTVISLGPDGETRPVAVAGGVHEAGVLVRTHNDLVAAYRRQRSEIDRQHNEIALMLAEAEVAEAKRRETPAVQGVSVSVHKVDYDILRGEATLAVAVPSDTPISQCMILTPAGGAA